MATATIYANKEHSIAYTSGGLNVGTSNEKHAPLGEGNSGWDWKELIKFPLTVSDFNGITQITSAVLRIKTTSENHCSNDTGTCRVRGLNGSFAATGGGTSDASDSWKTNADPVWPVSSIGTTGTLGSRTGGWANNTVYDIDITDYIEKYAPASILKRSGAPCDDVQNNGMVLDMNGATGISMEFQTIRNSYSPRIIVTGTTTPVPEAPTGLTPTGTLADIPDETDFAWSGDAADEDPLTSWDFQMEEDAVNNIIVTPDIDLADQTAGISGVSVASPTITGLSALLQRGHSYSWKVRHENSEGVNGDWSTVATFYISDVPDAPTLVNPTVAKPYAPISNLDDTSVWTGSGGEAIASITFTYNHPDGLAGTHYTIDWGGTEYEVALAMEDGENYTVPAPAAQGRGAANSVNMKVKCKDQNGNYGAYSSTVAVVCQWAQGIFNYEHGSGAGDLSHSYVLASGDVAFLYRKADGTPGAWKASIGDVTPSTHLDILVRLATDDSGVNPQLTSMELQYVATGSLPPDTWAVSGTGASIVLDSSRRRFGRRSCKVTPGSATTYLYPTYGTADPYLIVTPGEEYTWSIFIWSDTAISDASMRIHDGSDNFIGETAITPAGNSEWERFSHTFTVPEGVTRIKPIVRFAANEAVCWVDSAQFEEGGIATQWRPGGIGPAVSIDVGGIQLDAEKGAIFRMLGDDGTQVVQMKTGLTFRNVTDASEVEVTNQGTSELQVDGDLTVTGDIGAANYPPSVALTHAVTVYASGSGNWTKPAGLAFVVVEVQGGGGGGGGADGAASGQACAAGGSGGGYARKMWLASELSSTCAYVVGAGGGGGAGSGANAGSAGGDSTFTTTAPDPDETITGGGGSGGAGHAATTGNAANLGPAGGSASGGDINIPGGTGGARQVTGGVRSVGINFGGVSHLGNGGRAQSSAAGGNGEGYGSGGAGGIAQDNNNYNGGDGAAGVVIVHEYYLPTLS